LDTSVNPQVVESRRMSKLGGYALGFLGVFLYVFYLVCFALVAVAVTVWACHYLFG